jgi:hypothetical protein
LPHAEVQSPHEELAEWMADATEGEEPPPDRMSM